MKILSVWDKSSTGVNEKCLINTNGDYVGLKTGKLYPKSQGYYHSKQHIAIIKSIDDKNKTGMFHLDDPAEADFKKQKMKNLIGCYVTLESAHYMGDKKIYRCIELTEYVSEDEVEILTEQYIRKWKIEDILNNELYR